MSVNLVKGERAYLTKGSTTTNFSIGCGWDLKSSGTAADLDVFVVSVDDTNKPVENGLCYFNQKSIFGGAVVHSGDNLTGVGDGDDETIKVTLATVPANVDKLVIAINIYEAASRSQNFGQVKNAFVRVYETETGTEVVKFDLSEDFSANTGVFAGKIYRNNGEWKFSADGVGFNGSITDAIATL